MIRIPKRFYDDCRECETLVPAIVRETQAHYFVDVSDKETMADFLGRARYYEDEGYFSDGVGGICKSAKATLRALGCSI